MVADFYVVWRVKGKKGVAGIFFSKDIGTVLALSIILGKN